MAQSRTGGGLAEFFFFFLVEATFLSADGNYYSDREKLILQVRGIILGLKLSRQEGRGFWE